MAREMPDDRLRLLAGRRDLVGSCATGLSHDGRNDNSSRCRADAQSDLGRCKLRAFPSAAL